MSDRVRTPRTNKIVRVKAQDFTIKVLRKILMKYIEEGPYAWELIKDTLEETVYKVPNWVDGEYGYFGMKYDELRVGSTYKNWLFNVNNMRTEIAYNEDCLNAERVNRVECSSGSVTVYSGTENLLYDIEQCVPGDTMNPPTPKNDTNMQYGWDGFTTYQISSAEQFLKNANVLFFTMFKQYENGIDWKERMGNQRVTSCPRRISYMRSGGSIKSGGVTWNDPYPKYWTKPPLYPGVGCPAIGSAPNWFANNDKGNEWVTVYLSRTKHNIMVVINFQEYWDMAQFGFYEPFDSLQEYPFPAFVMSSNIGARPHVTLENDQPGKPYPYPHLIYDYTQDNISLGHSMPCFTASFWDGNVDFLNKHGNSPIQAMNPSGQWKSMINWGIRSDFYYVDSPMRLGLWHSFKEPERVEAKNYNTLYHSDVYKMFAPFSKLNKITWIDWDLSNLDEYIENTNTCDFNMQPLLMTLQETPNIDQNMLGVIPATYWCPYPVNRYGLYKNNGRFFLLVPNIKERRRWYENPWYAVFLGKTQSSEEMEKEKNRIDELSDNMNSVFDLGENISFERWKDDA